MPDAIMRPRAQLDLESIYVYIALSLGSPKAAEDTVEAIYRAIDLVADVPDIGTPFESDRLSRSYRRTFAKSYWIYCSVEEGRITVWRIFHTRQDIDNATLVDL